MGQRWGCTRLGLRWVGLLDIPAPPPLPSELRLRIRLRAYPRAKGRELTKPDESPRFYSSALNTPSYHAFYMRMLFLIGKGRYYDYGRVIRRFFFERHSPLIHSRRTVE